MNKDVLKNIHIKILDDVKVIQKAIMDELLETLPYGGQLSDDDQAELKMIATITGQVFGSLIRNHEEVTDMPGKENFLQIEINGKKYVCQKEYISYYVEPAANIQQIDPKRISAPINAPAQKSPNPVKEQATQYSYEGRSEDCEQQNNDPSSSLAEYLEHCDDNEPNDIEDSSIIAPERTEDLEEETYVHPDDEIDIASNKEKEWPDETNDMNQSEEECDENEEDEDDEEELESAPRISNFSLNNVFIEEKKKKASEFVFDKYRINVNKNISRGGGRTEDMTIMIAPLRIYPIQCASAPIIVSIYHKGRIYTKSSYDIEGDGQNMVKIEVDECYFLIRGYFEDSGAFRSTIQTTDISSIQGDKIIVVSSESHGDYKNAKNGHIIFKNEIENDLGETKDGVIEIFPLDLSDNDFVILSRDNEFIDYLTIMNTNGISRAILTEGRKKKEIKCKWNGDYLVAEISEV